LFPQRDGQCLITFCLRDPSQLEQHVGDGGSMSQLPGKRQSLFTSRPRGCYVAQSELHSA